MNGDGGAEMNVNLFIIGLLLIVFGYFIGVKQKIEFITFLKNRHVSNRGKVANLMGGSQLILGAFLITLGALGFQYDPVAIVFVLIVLLVISVYVMREYVE